MKRKEKLNWRQWFQSKGRLQVLAVLLALIAWFIVQTSQPTKEFRYIDVEYMGSSRLSLVKEPVDRVRVTLQGTLHRIRSLEDDELRIEIDLDRFSPGKHMIDFDVGNLNLPNDIVVSNPFPRRFEITLEEQRSKSVPVEVDIIAPPPDLIAVRRITVDPNPIQIRGATSLLQGIDEVRIPLDLSGRRKSFESSVIYEPPHPLLESVRLLTLDVELSVLDHERVFEKVKVVSENPRQDVQFTPPQAKVILRGTKEDFEDENFRLKVVVPVEGLSRDLGQRVEGRVEVSSPNIRVVSLEPRFFIVDFKR